MIDNKRFLDVLLKCGVEFFYWSTRLVPKWLLHLSDGLGTGREERLLQTREMQLRLQLDTSLAQEE